MSIRKSMAALAAASLLTGCAADAQANGSGWVVHEGDIVGTYAACRGEPNGEVMLRNLEEQELWNDAMRARFYDGRCKKFKKPLGGIVHRVVRASVDYEDEILFLVELEDPNGQPIDIYTLVWHFSLIRPDAEPEEMKGQSI